MAIFTDDDGRVVATQSMLRTFRDCPRKAHYKYVERLKSRRVSVPLRRGTWMHKLLETHYAGGDWREMHQKLTHQFMELFEEERDDLGDLPTQCKRLMRGYLWHYKEEQLKVHEVEYIVETKLPDGTYFRCRVDMLVEDDLGLWLWDHKCVAPDTPVSTPLGLRTMGDLNVGDQVMGSSGVAIQVVDLNRRTLPVFEIRLRSGKRLKATAEHRWPVVYRGKQSIKTTAWISKMLSTGRPVKLLPSATLQFEEQQHVLDPYLLGALIGDGSFLQQISFCSNHENTVKRVLELLPNDATWTRDHKPPRVVRHRFASRILRQELRRLGLEKKHGRHKFIPPQYLLGTIDQRMALLTGLLDTDGSSRKGLPLYQTGSKQLATDVRVLVESLGGVAWLRVNKAPKLQGDKIGRPNWTVYIRLPEELGNPFLHEEKAARVRVSSRDLMTAVISVEPLGESEVIDIEVDSEDHLFTLHGVQSHNTHKTLPNFNNRMFDLQSMVYVWVARREGIPVEGFTWNYMRTEGLKLPPPLMSGARLARWAACDIDYPTAVEAIKRSGVPVRPHRDKLAQLKKLQWRPGQPQLSTYYRRVTLERSKAMMQNMADETIAGIIRMNRYFPAKNPRTIERHTGRPCGWCEFAAPCLAEYTGGNPDILIRQGFRVGNPMSYYNDDKQEELQS